jgi:hypothetical protein
MKKIKYFFLKNRTEILILFLVLAIRITYVILIFDEESFNRWMPGQFDSRALLLVNGGEKSFITAWASYYVPLAGLYKVLQLVNLLGSRLVIAAIGNCVLGALSCVYVFKISKAIFNKSKLLQILITISFILYYPNVYFNALSLSENIFTPILIYLFYHALTLKRKYFKAGVIAGLLFGLALIMRPIIVPFMPFFFFYIYKNYKGGIINFIAQYIFPFIFCTLLIVIPTIIINHNHDKNGVYSFTGNGGVNIAMAWCEPRKIRYKLENGESFWFAPPSLRDNTEADFIQTDVPFYNQGYYYKMGFECLKKNPKRLLTNFKHVFNIFHSEMYPDFSPFPFHSNLLIIWKILVIPLITAFFIFPFVWKKKLKEWLLAAALILTLLVTIYLTSPGEERYSVPHYFILIVFGLATIYKVISATYKIQTRRNVSFKKKTLALTFVSIPFIITFILLGYLYGELIQAL